VQKVKKLPQRQCVGCRERKEKRELIRVVRSPEGGISLDFKGKKPGRGAYLCCNEFARYAGRHRNGRIVNVSSCRAHRPNELESIAYSTSKLALHCLTRSYAAALARYGITVNTLAPGMIATENMFKRIGRRGYETECGNIALHRAGTCDEIADGLIWAVENGFMTGETININGGQTYAP